MEYARTDCARDMELKSLFRQVDTEDVDLFDGTPSRKAVQGVILHQCGTAKRARPRHRL